MSVKFFQSRERYLTLSAFLLLNFLAAAGVKSGVNILELFIRNMGVNLGGGDGGVPQKSLNGA